MSQPPAGMTRTYVTHTRLFLQVLLQAKLAVAYWRDIGPLPLHWLWDKKFATLNLNAGLTKDTSYIRGPHFRDPKYNTKNWPRKGV